jgi:dolichyl-phosphate beta-glucosyltransferase
MPALQGASGNVGLLRVTLLIPAKNSGHSLESAVTEAHRFLGERFGESFEIILIPNPSPSDPRDDSPAVAASIADRLPRVRVCLHEGKPGKGAALRSGFAQSRGEWLYFTDADLPYDLDFFDRAAQELSNGVEFVTGNRRMPISQFDIPVRLLPLAYRRHRLGVLFNRFVRLLMPIATTDTQAGAKAMSRRMAAAAFGRQTCDGFFFDLEFFLTARRQGFCQKELPVTLYLNSEKTTVRVLRESALAVYWLVRIFWQDRRRAYEAVR